MNEGTANLMYLVCFVCAMLGAAASMGIAVFGGYGRIAASAVGALGALWWMGLVLCGVKIVQTRRWPWQWRKG